MVSLGTLINLHIARDHSEKKCLPLSDESDVEQPHFGIKLLTRVLAVSTAANCAAVVAYVAAR